MNYNLKNAKIFLDSSFTIKDVAIENGVLQESNFPNSASSFDFSNCYIFPGFIDVHVHLREPGFFYKETIASGTAAAAHGGYTHVFSMPNLNPVPDSLENLKVQLDIIKKDAKIHVSPYAAITKGEMGKELSAMEELSDFCIAFSDDGKGVQSEELMSEAMKRAKRLGKIIVAHCEDNSLLHGGYIHDGEYAKKHAHRGISSESEWKPIQRDLALAEKIGCKYHICHVSAKESVELIRQAKKRGVDVTAETAPHYLVMNDMDLQEDARFKMNPPIRSEADRLALIEGICDGTIDMIATDHAPHSFEEKSKGLEKSLMGVVGLETAFPVLYTELVKKGIISLEQLIKLMYTNPKKRFGVGDSLKIGEPSCFTVFNLDKKYMVKPADFLTMGKSTPFSGCEVYGECLMTVCDGKIVWNKEV